MIKMPGVERRLTILYFGGTLAFIFGQFLHPTPVQDAELLLAMLASMIPLVVFLIINIIRLRRLIRATDLEIHRLRDEIDLWAKKAEQQITARKAKK